jgi:hypothetical protein
MPPQMCNRLDRDPVEVAGGDGEGRARPVIAAMAIGRGKGPGAAVTISSRFGAQHRARNRTSTTRGGAALGEGMVENLPGVGFSLTAAHAADFAEGS